MANLTVTIDDDVLRRARMKALEHGTSVNALVREYLEGLTSGADTSALDAFIAEAAGSEAGSGGRGHDWTRDDLHERRPGTT